VLPAEKIGDTVIIETGNHLQSVAVLDLFVRDGSFKLADASGIELAQQRADLSRRIDELHVKISNWERDGKIPAADLDARRADLAKLEKDRAALDVVPPPTQGSFFRYTVQEIRPSLGTDDAITANMAAYYKSVNEHNKIAFADRMPPSHGPDQPAYVGVAVCSTCHADARKFWDTTKHAHAYETLASQFKEYNLDCVSCHVTGYELPGGSTVTHVDYLKDVQCEVCHGPGSRHATAPHDPTTRLAMPKPDQCLSCHHPPHVEQFDAHAKMEEIVGPGHGRAK
jgi:hypothetical protein